MKQCSSIAVLCVIVIGIAADLPAQANKFKVGYSTIGFGQSLLWITKEANIFAENCLDVELLYIVSSATATQALLARDVPIVNMSGIAAISANLAGQDLVMVASPRNDPAQSFLVTSKDIKEFSQLKGRKLGVSRFGSSSDFLLRYILKKIGLVPERDVSIVQVGSASVRMAALANGAIDGTALTVEEVLVARKLGFTGPGIKRAEETRDSLPMNPAAQPKDLPRPMSGPILFQTHWSAVLSIWRPLPLGLQRQKQIAVAALD
jgi:ABC-type nitrate/sulfonate/bicarbonate transport system substrate-binding protein